VSDVEGSVGLTCCNFFVCFLLSPKYSICLFHTYLNCSFEDPRSSEETIVQTLLAENNTATQRYIPGCNVVGYAEVASRSWSKDISII